MVAGHRRRGHRARERAIRDWQAGDAVILNGWGVGETHWGCLAEQARAARATGWCALPAGLRRAPGDGDRHRRLHRDAVRAGAGARTASQPGDGDGAGDRRDRRRRQRRGRAAGASSATASSRRPARPSEADYLKRARRRRGRSTAPSSAAPGKPLQKERWAGGGRRGRQPHAGQRAARRRATAARSPPAGWRRAWTCRHRGALHPARRDAGRASTA